MKGKKEQFPGRERKKCRHSSLEERRKSAGHGESAEHRREDRERQERVQDTGERRKSAWTQERVQDTGESAGHRRECRTQERGERVQDTGGRRKSAWTQERLHSLLCPALSLSCHCVLHSCTLLFPPVSSGHRRECRTQERVQDTGETQEVSPGGERHPVNYGPLNGNNDTAYHVPNHPNPLSGSTL
jgi:hypothetical protein